MAIIEDWRAQVVGWFMGALDLFELAILPTLLYNAETWVGISKDSENRLENLQLFFLRLAFRVPQSTPKIGDMSSIGNICKIFLWSRGEMYYKII